MGEVYRATDTRLGRDVALKLLPEAFASDPDRLVRFEREAKLLASLSHPNIAGLFALEDARPDEAAAPVRFLAMELVVGEELAERLKRGAIPAEEALPIARQIAEALEEAHEKGIVHRDLKPANVKVTPDGRVKVLDFGLAKAWSGDTLSGAAPELSQSPTLAHTGTAAGLILGTAAYMSPEQARGRAVDKRADVWAFGVLLFEMLTGRRLFEGETVSDTLAAVLRQEIDWLALPASTPVAIRSLLGRCLERDPKRRLRDVGEARIVLESPLVPAGAVPSDVTAWRRSGRRAWLPWAVAVAALAVAAFLALHRKPEETKPPLVQLDAQLADDIQLASLIGHRIALSPDGKRLVFVAMAGPESALYLRALDHPRITLIPDTARALQPFFSPDGHEVGFFTGSGEIRRVSLAGGASNVITTTTTDARGATWGEGGTIVFGASQEQGLFRVPASGGTPVPLTTLDAGKYERSHRWPSFLPSGQKLLFNAQAVSRSFDDSTIELLDLASGRCSPLGAVGSAPRYADGRVLFVRHGKLHAAPLDAASETLAGAHLVLGEDVQSDPRNGSAQYSVSQTGALAFVLGQGAYADRFVTWSDRSGRTLPFLDKPDRYMAPRFSPDGRRVAFQIGEIGREDIYVAPAAGGSATRLTFEERSDSVPVWSPDAQRIVYASVKAGRYVFLVQSADGSGSPEPIYEAPPRHFAIPSSWSRDGATLLFQESRTGSVFDILALDLRSGKTRSIVSTPATEVDACLSPDGRFVAYSAGTQGARQLYVRTLAEGGGQWQLSTEGGIRPSWLQNGEIVYEQPGRPLSQWISVPVRTSGSAFEAGAQRALFHGRVDSERLLRTWDVSPDGSRFALVQPVDETTEAAGVRIRMIFGWTRLLDWQAE